MELITATMDPGGTQYAEGYRIPAYFGKRLMTIVKRTGDDRIRLLWYSYPDHKEVMSWPENTRLQEIMDYISNLPAKRDSMAFTLP
jgi:hypothetical protein